MSDAHRFPYRWRLADGYPAKGINGHGSTVFGTFICGGGSTMGYKLAGYHHLGGVEIDPNVAAVYRANHNPEHLFIEDLRKFNERTDLPDELYNLDVLDGSPPCSTFSMAGQREKAWGKKKVFREGQAEQTLDDLVFVYCDTIAKLRPRVCLLENVAGLVRGNARSYCRRIVDRLHATGYKRLQAFLLNAATMGVPQTRVRTFMIGLRDDLPDVGKLEINVNETPILFGEVRDRDDMSHNLSEYTTGLWRQRLPTDFSMADIKQHVPGVKVSGFNNTLLHDNRVASTITHLSYSYLFEVDRKINTNELLHCSSFPEDYTSGEAVALKFFVGMSVSPVQMAHIADAIYNQWLKPIKEGSAT